MEDEEKKILLEMGFENTKCPKWATIDSMCWRCPGNLPRGVCVGTPEHMLYLRSVNCFDGDQGFIVPSCERRAYIMNRALELVAGISE
jgi:hypothetical protein